MARPSVIADASALICLGWVDQLQILPAIFSRIVVPPAVAAEVTHRQPGAAAVSASRLSAASRPAVGRLICNTDYPKLRPGCGLLLVASGIGPPAPGHAAPALGRHVLRNVGELVASLAPPSAPRPGWPAWLRPAAAAACSSLALDNRSCLFDDSSFALGNSS